MAVSQIKISATVYQRDGHAKIYTEDTEKKKAVEKKRSGNIVTGGVKERGLEIFSLVLVSEWQ